MRPYTGTVAVTGLNATDNPGPGVAVARSLRADAAFAGRIVGLAYDSLDPGLYFPDLLDAAYLVPYPSAGREALFERLAYVQERERAQVLLPNLDSELPALMGHEGTLAGLGLGTLLPTRESHDRRTKARLHRLRDEGLPVPEAEILTEVEPLYTAGERLGFPLVVKGVFYGAAVCHSLDEALRAFHATAARWGLPVIVQAFIPGEDLNVAAVGDGRGGLVGAVAMRKLLLTDKGKGWAGVAISDARLLALSAQLVRVLRWRGPCEIEVRKDQDGELHLLEINPRMPAWIDLTQGAGQNLPLAVTRLAAGEEVAPLPPYRPGAAFVRISYDQLLHISDLDGISTLGEMTGSPRRAP